MDNKVLARRVFEEMFNGNRPEVADELYAADHVYHDPSAPLPDGPAGIKVMVEAFCAAFPDLRTTVEDVFSEGDRVALRYVSEGTNTGPFMGAPATGRRIRVTGTTIYRIADGRIAESWAVWDNVGLLQQLGLR